MDYHYARIIEKCIWTLLAGNWSHLKQWCTGRSIVITVVLDVDNDSCRQIAVMARRNTAVFHNYSSDSDVDQILYRRTRAVLKKWYQIQRVERHRLSFPRGTFPWKYFCFSMGHESSLCLGERATCFYLILFAKMSFPLKHCKTRLSATNTQDHQISVKVWDGKICPMRRLSLLPLVYEH